MNIEDAKSKLQSEREAYWGHLKGRLKDPNLKKLKRRIQNRINQHVSRWTKFFYLETAEDHHILACELKDMREGRAKRREGRLRRPEDLSKRRTSKRLADKRRKPEDIETSEEDSLVDSAIDFDLDQLDDTPPSKGDVNISTEVTTSRPSLTSRSDDFAHGASYEIGRTPDSISGSFFDLCNSQALSQYSNIPSLADETWYRSDDMSEPASISGTLHSGTNLASDRCVGSLQQDICDDNPMDWHGDLASFSASNVLSGNGDNWSGMDIFEPESHRSVVPQGGLIIAPLEDLDLYNPIKSTSGNVNGCTQTKSSVVPVLPERVDNGMQPREFDQAQLYIIMTEMTSQLRERRKHSIPKRPVPPRRSPLAERQDLAPLIEQCLSTLRGPTPHMPGSKTDGTGLKDRTVKRYGIEVDLRMTVEYLWNAVRAEPCRIHSRIS